MELDNDVKYVVKWIRTIKFQLESGGTLEYKNVLYVTGLKKKLILVSVIEDIYLQEWAGAHSSRGF